MYDLDDLQDDELIKGDGVSEKQDAALADLIPLTVGDEDIETEEDEDDLSNPFFTNKNTEDEDEDSEETEEDEESEEGTEEELDSITESAAINELLLAKGIDNPKAVKFQDEDGEIVETNFYELPYEEQIEILKSSDSDINFGLQDSEIETINFLRRNNVSFEDAVEYYKRQAVEEYIKENSTNDFKVDNYTDEELFVLDLQSKFEDLTQEELEIELEKANAHPDLFKKKIDKIREEYRNLEDLEQQEEENRKQEEENEKFELLKNDLIEVATELEDIGGIDLEIADKNDILEFILLKDVNGKSNLDKLMSDPSKLFELAWYASKGQQAFDFIHSYYKKEIENVRKNTLEKAKADLSKTRQTITPRKNAVKKEASPARRNIKSMEDLFD